MSDLKKFKELSNRAYVPYSNFHVLAFFELNDGTSFWGVNIENASYPNTMCAERVGIHSALRDGIDLKEVKTIHIFSPDSKDILSPCGGCRQTLAEHLYANVEVKMYNKKGDFISKKLGDLLPFVVSPKNIKGEN